MSSLDSLVERQAREIEELKAQLSAASAESEQKLRFKDAELENRKEHHIRDIEKLTEDLKRESDIKEHYGEQLKRATSTAMQFRDQAIATAHESVDLRQHLKASNQTRKEALKLAAYLEEHAARLNEHLAISEKQRAHLHQLASDQAAHFDQRAYRLNGQLAEAAKEAESLKAQLYSTEEEMTALREKLEWKNNIVYGPCDNHSRCEDAVRKADEELAACKEILSRIREDHCRTMRETEAQHAKRIRELQGMLLGARAELNSMKASEIESTGTDSAIPRKRSLEPSVEFAFAMRGVKAKTEEPSDSERHPTHAHLPCISDHGSPS